MEKSFKERINNLWRRFVSEEAEIRTLIDNKDKSEIISEKVSSILKDAFVNPFFEIGKNGQNKYELTLTPEGDKCMLFALEYWRKNVPQELLKTWNFFSSRQICEISDLSLEMYGVSINKNDIQIYYEVNTQSQKVDIKIYCSKINELDQNKQYNIIFVLLDQHIGEIYTMEYIGSIDIIDQPLPKSISIDYLKEVIDNSIKEYNWFPPQDILEKCNSYEMNPSEAKDWQLREDIYVGYTSCFSLLNAFYDKTDKFFNNFAQDGIIFGFVFFKNVNIPKNNLVDFRSDIEEKILQVATSEKTAEVIGGATGFYFSYMDFIIYDLEEFIETIKKVLAEYSYLGETGYSHFVFGSEPYFISR